MSRNVVICEVIHAEKSNVSHPANGYQDQAHLISFVPPSQATFLFISHIMSHISEQQKGKVGRKDWP